jgi:hypothetical protein
MFSSEKPSEQNSESLLLFLFLGTEFPEVFASFFVPCNVILSCFLFRGMVQNRIPRVCFYFCSMVQNFELFSPLWNGLEGNAESFMFRVMAGTPPEQTNCSLYSVFRGIIFLSEIANPNSLLLHIRFILHLYLGHCSLYYSLYCEYSGGEEYLQTVFIVFSKDTLQARVT